MRRLLVTVACALVLAGCGENDSGSNRASTTEAPRTEAAPPTATTGEPRTGLSERDVIARADAECRALETRAGPLATESRQTQDLQRVAVLTRRIAAEAEAASARLRAIFERADSDRAAFLEYVDLADSQFALLERIARALDAGDAAAAQRLIASGRDEASRSRRLARTLGLEVCGTGALD